MMGEVGAGGEEGVRGVRAVGTRGHIERLHSRLHTQAMMLLLHRARHSCNLQQRSISKLDKISVSVEWEFCFYVSIVVSVSHCLPFFLFSLMFLISILPNLFFFGLSFLISHLYLSRAHFPCHIGSPMTACFLPLFASLSCSIPQPFSLSLYLYCSLLPCLSLSTSDSIVSLSFCLPPFCSLALSRSLCISSGLA